MGPVERMVRPHKNDLRFGSLASTLYNRLFQQSTKPAYERAHESELTRFTEQVVVDGTSNKPIFVVNTYDFLLQRSN